MLGAPLPRIQFGNFLSSGFPWLIARFRGFIFSGFHFFGVSPFSEFQFRDFRLFGFSIRRSPPFRGFNSGISAFSGFQFGDPRLFGVSIRGFPLFRGFDSGIFVFSSFISGILAGIPTRKVFLVSFGSFAHFLAHFRFFFSGKWVHFRVFFGQLAPFRGFFSGNQVHFGQVDPFRGFFSGKWVHFGASFRAIGSISVFSGAIGSILGISLRRLGPFFCFFKSLVPFRGFCSGNACSILGDVSCNWVELGEPFGSCSNNSAQSSLLPQQFLQNPEHRNFRRRFPEDHGRLRPPSPSIPCLGNGFDLFLQILVQVHGNGYLANRPPQPPVGPASPPHSLGSQAPPQKAPKTWKIFQGIFSVKLNLWLPSKQFGTPQEICAKNV